MLSQYPPCAISLRASRLSLLRLITNRLLPGLILAALAAPVAHAAAAATVTTLTASSIATTAGTPVKLTVTVTSGGVPVTSGQVAICNYATADCSASEAFAVLQLSVLGTASTYFYGLGSQFLQAGFAGTASFARSYSAADYQVNFSSATLPTNTSIAVSGIAGAYTLTGSVAIHSLPVTSPDFPSAAVSFYDSSNSNYLLGNLSVTGTSTNDIFIQGIPPAAGTNPAYVATGDFNGDGKADLAIVNSNDNTVSILIGNGDGTFHAQVPYATGHAPGPIVVGDFNADGNLDLAVVNKTDQTISIFFGAGDGTFIAQVLLPATGNNPIALAIGDINQDGLPDLVVLNHDDKTIGILMNSGVGTFAAQVTYATGNDPRGIAVGDSKLAAVPSDGIPDVAIANFADNTITILDGAGDGTLLAATAQTTIATGNGPIAVSFADVADVGYASLSWLNYTDGTMSIIATQFLGSIAAQANYSTGGNPVAFTFGTFDITATPEVAVLNSDGSLSVYITSGNYDGSYGPTPTTYITAQAGAVSMLNADFDGDGNPDIVLGGALGLAPALYLQQQSYSSQYVLSHVSVPGISTSNVVAVYPGETTFTASTSAPVSLTDSPILTATSIALSPSQNVTPGQTITITSAIMPTSLGNYIPTGSITFLDGSTVVCSAVPLASFSASCTTPALGISHNVFTAVYSGDTYFHTSTSLVKIINVSNTTTTALTLSSASVTQGTFVTATATVTQDSNSSLVPGGVVNFCEATTPASACTGVNLLGTALLESAHGSAPGTASVKLSLAVGTHSIQAVFQGTSPEKSSTSTALPLTVATPTTSASTTTISSTGSAGSYTITGTVVGSQYTLSPTGSLSFTDTKNSGFAVQSGALGSATVAATFSTASTYAVPGDIAQTLTMADVSGDGIPDVLVPDYDNCTMGVRLGNANGTFGTETDYTLSTGDYCSPWSITVGDINGDGKPDVLVADDGYNFATSSAVGSVYVFFGHGNGTFSATPDETLDIGDEHSPQATSGSYPGPSSTIIADFNQDGIPDLAVGTDEGAVYILLGNGDGTFQTPVLYPAVNVFYDQGVVGLTAVDLNGDGFLDITYTEQYDPAATVMISNGDGTFQNPVEQENTGQGSFDGGYAIADLNGDGFPDAVISDGGICVALGNGDATFQNPTCYTTSSGTENIVIGDFNHDGNLDVAAALDSGGIGLFSGNGDGTFNAIKKFSAGSSDLGLAAADINGDGMLDIATTSSGSNKVELILQKITSTATHKFTAVSIPGSATTSQHSLVATYAGDSHYATSSSTGLAIAGSPISTTSALVPSLASGVAYGTAISLTDTLTPAITSGFTIAGTVTFKDGSTTLTPTGAFGTGAAAGTSTYGSFTPTVGAHSYTAVYNVDSVANFKTSTSNTLSFTVVQATPVITWTPPATIYTGNTLSSVLTATTTPAGTFSYTATPSGGSSTAVTAATVLAAGTYTITASFVPTDTTDYATPAAVNKALTVSTENVWVLNNNGSISEFNDGGTPAGGSAVISGGAGTATGGGVAFDSAGNIWSVNSTAGQLLEATKTGGTPTTVTGGGLNAPVALAVDGNGAIWVANSTGSVSAFTNGGTPLSPATVGYTGGSMNAPTGIAIDISGNVWISNSGNDSETEILGGAAPVAPLATGVATTTLGAKP